MTFTRWARYSALAWMSLFSPSAGILMSLMAADEKFLDRLLNNGREGGTGKPVAADDLAKRKITPGDRERFGHVGFDVLERVRLAPTRTDKVPNTSATAASAGADLNGGGGQGRGGENYARAGSGPVQPARRPRGGVWSGG